MQTSKLNFGTVVVATGLTDPASSALRYAQAIARNHGSTLIIMYVVDPVGYAFPGGTPAAFATDQAAREELSRIENETRRQGIPVHSIIESGVICERILQALCDHHANLLVLGTQAKTEAGRVALGTIARQLLAKAPCPILTVSPDADEYLSTAGRWRNVLAATNFSAASLAALSYAHRMAHEQLTALHVMDTYNQFEHSHCLEQLRFLAPLNESHTVPLEHIVMAGDAPRIIFEHAQHSHADLIVIGSPDNQLTEEAFSSSTVLQVISDAKCPVLCVPATKGLSPTYAMEWASGDHTQRSMDFLHAGEARETLMAHK